jgi:hypothetical protein
MNTLKQQMELHGFVSHTDYEYAVQCLLNANTDHIRCLNIEGEPGRRKTAFANALAHALESPRILYFEFGLEQKAPIIIKLNEEETLDKSEIDPFDKIMTEACALSEAEQTILIIDQLHLADFRQHMRLYNFLVSKVWSYSDVSYVANQTNLSVFMISESPLYHALQQTSFKVWIESLSNPGKPPKASELSLDTSAEDWINILGEIFSRLELNPTLNTYKKIAHDIEHHVRTADQLRTSIYGWVEGAHYPRLFRDELDELFKQAELAIEQYIGYEDTIELSGDIENHLDVTKP